MYREVDYEKVSIVGGGPAGVRHDGLGVQFQHWLLEYVVERVHAVALGSAHDAMAKPEPGSMDVDEPMGQLQSVRVRERVWMLESMWMLRAVSVPHSQSDPQSVSVPDSGSLPESMAMPDPQSLPITLHGYRYRHRLVVEHGLRLWL